MRVKRASAVLAATMLAGAGLAIVPATTAAAQDIYTTCGPKISVSSGMSNVSTVDQDYFGYRADDASTLKLNRGNKAGYGQAGVYWAKIQTGRYADTLPTGATVELWWSDYDPNDSANRCVASVGSGRTYAYTTGINSVYSSASPWGSRVFSACGHTHTTNRAVPDKCFGWYVSY